jgi:hypothetical protein
MGGNVGKGEGNGRDGGASFCEEQSPMGDAEIVKGGWGNLS